jgi:hypothetical protein
MEEKGLHAEPASSAATMGCASFCEEGMDIDDP